MFLLGILVGRGTSPVTFDTQKFQKRLAVISKEYGRQKKNGTQKKVELQFYKVLDDPVREEEAVNTTQKKKKVTTEIIPDKVKELWEIPIKKSKKHETFKKPLNVLKSEIIPDKALGKKQISQKEREKNLSQNLNQSLNKNLAPQKKILQ